MAKKYTSEDFKSLRKIWRPFHRTVGDLFENNLSSSYKLVKDAACGGNQNIPLFCSKEKSNATEYCNVDLLVIKDGTIRIIVEIDASDVRPTKLCGKFLTSALTQYYINESENDIPIGMHDSVIFIQILDTSKLKDETSKFKQWKNLQKSIEDILPVKGSRIKEYKIFYGDESYFEKNQSNELVSYIKEL